MIQPNEIADVANTVHDRLAQAEACARQLDKEQHIAYALVLSCKLLTRLRETDIVVEYGRAVADGNREALRHSPTLQGGAVELVSEDLEHFEFFLTNEVELLRCSGFGKGLTDLLAQNIREGIDALRSNQPSGPLLDRALSQMKDHVCSQREQMVRALQEPRTKGGLLLGLGGIGLISANIIGAPGLTPIGVGASATIGGGLIVESVKTITNELALKMPRIRKRGH